MKKKILLAFSLIVMFALMISALSAGQVPNASEHSALSVGQVLNASEHSALSVGQVLNASEHSQEDDYEKHSENEIFEENSENEIFEENSGNVFENNSVIITLSRDATRKFNTYTPKDFMEVDCIAIEDLTQFTTDYVRKKIQGKATEKSMLVNAESFRRTLKLELKVKKTNDIFRAIDILEKREDILFAGPNYIRSIAATPNDTHYGHVDQWGLNGLNGISAPGAWDTSTGLSTVTVGVLDTGIQANHPDLINRISTAGLHRDCTVNPIITVANNDLTDPNGHGTHVAGIIGAQGNNGIGIAGVAWDIRLVSLRVSDANGNGSVASEVRAINFAASQNIPILNFSGGGYEEDVNERNAIASYTGLFVSSAGNEELDVDKSYYSHFPSGYANENNNSYSAFSNRVISVGAIAIDGTRSSFSNYSNSGDTVSVYAPGTKILSTVPTSFCGGGCGNLFHSWSSEHHANGYHYLSGTSMATPFVTGVAALLLSHNSSLTAAQLKDAIINGATVVDITIPNPNGNGGTVTRSVRRLNANYAVKRVGFRVNEVGNEITGFFNLTSEIVIPRQVNGVTITSIGQGAFNGANITKVTCQEGSQLQNIGRGAFGSSTCSEILLPNSVKTIGAFAFNYCINLQSISLPSSIETIGEMAFSYCCKLTTITIPDNVVNIGNYAFYGCTGLTIYAEAASKPGGWDNNWNPSDCPVIWGYNSDSLIPEDFLKFTLIGSGYEVSVRTCGTLRGNLIIPSYHNDLPVIRIADYGFYDNYSAHGYTRTNEITSIVIPSTVKSIGDHAFHFCTKLQTIIFESNSQLASIGNYAFTLCNLKSVNIPNSVTSIGNCAFSGCINLTNVIMPSVTSMGSNVFFLCTRLTIYYY